MKTFKSNIIFVLLALFTFSSCAETKEASFNTRKFVKQYKDYENVISFSLPPALLRVFVDRDEKELKELLKQIDDMRYPRMALVQSCGAAADVDDASVGIRKILVEFLSG